MAINILVIGVDMYNVLLLRSQDILSDSRVLRYEEWFKLNGIKYRIVGWDRELKHIERINTDYYISRAGFHQRIHGIFDRLKWNVFLLKYLFKYRDEYKVIHACDFDTVMPALVMKLFSKKVIFDIFDWFSDETRTGKFLIDWSINFLEKLSVRLSDVVILCDEGRLKQIGIEPNNYIIIPNMSLVNAMNFDNKIIDNKDTRVKIAYVGGIVPDRGIEELLDVVSKMPKVVLTIAGFGNEELVKKVKDYSLTYDNINYLGKIKYDLALDVMRNADILYAMYYKNNRNHVYAAPNKFYEAIFLGKPLITTQGTLVGDKVCKCGTGFVIDEGIIPLENLLKSTSIMSSSYEKIENIKNYQGVFLNTTHDAMHEYKKIISSRIG
jgi:glycosyltransferase involved in cell wall biosynthesis